MDSSLAWSCCLVHSTSWKLVPDTSAWRIHTKCLELVHLTFCCLRDKVPWVAAATGESTGLTPPGLNCQRQQPKKHPHEAPHGGSKPGPASLWSQNCHARMESTTDVWDCVSVSFCWSQRNLCELTKANHRWVVVNMLVNFGFHTRIAG